MVSKTFENAVSVLKTEITDAMRNASENEIAEMRLRTKELLGMLGATDDDDDDDDDDEDLWEDDDWEDEDDDWEDDDDDEYVPGTEYP